jgi:hypothetical protein
MPTSERKEWRRIFTETIMELAGGEADVLQAASWAMQAQAAHGTRDPREVAREEFKDGTPPIPD